MSPAQLPVGTPCRAIDSDGFDIGNCLFLGLDMKENRWHYHVLKDEHAQHLNVSNFTLIPLEIE